MTDVKEGEPLLLKTLPEQVSDNWDKFAPLIEQSLPPTVLNRRQRMANVLRSILMEELVVWVYIDSEKRERYVVSTQIRTDDIVLGKDLLIYSFTALGPLDSWEDIAVGFRTLKKYAKGNDCRNILAYVVDPSVKKILKRQGADVRFTLAQIEV